MVEDCASAEDQRSASRPEASDSASAKTARNAIAAEVNTVSRADCPVRGTTRSACASGRMQRGGIP
jgi:hypothetical protein